MGPSSFLATGVSQYPFVLAVTLGSVAVPVLPFFPVFFLRLIWPGVGKKKKLMPAFVFFFLLFPAQTSPCRLEEDPPRGSFLLHVMEGVFNGFLVPFLPSTPLLISTAVSF